MNDAWIKLYDTVRTSEFQRIQDNLAKSTNLAIITVDYKGRPLTNHSECSPFCSQIRQLPDYAKLCEKCDSHGGLEAARSKEPFIYRCHANVIDLAVPIIVNDMYLGAIMAGQVRLEVNESTPPIETIYRLSEIEALFEESPSFRNAYEKLPVMSYSKIEAAANILQTICKYMVQNPGERILSELTLTTEPVATSHIQGSADLLQPAIDYMHTHFAEKITLRHLAQICNVSDSYFSRLFSKNFGVSITKHIETIRIKQAKQMLVNPEMTVNYISQACGYDDTSYFIKLFKKAVGITPQEYRKTIGR